MSFLAQAGDLMQFATDSAGDIIPGSGQLFYIYRPDGTQISLLTKEWPTIMGRAQANALVLTARPATYFIHVGPYYYNYSG